MVGGIEQVLLNTCIGADVGEDDSAFFFLLAFAPDDAQGGNGIFRKEEGGVCGCDKLYGSTVHVLRQVFTKSVCENENRETASHRVLCPEFPST